MNKLNRKVRGIAAIAMLASAANAHAFGGDDEEEAAEMAAARSVQMSLAGAISAAESFSQGRAIEAGLEQDEDGSVYEVVAVVNGKSRLLLVDPRSGSVEEGSEGIFARALGAFERGRSAKRAMAAEQGSLLRAVLAAERFSGGKGFEAEFDDDDSRIDVDVALAGGDARHVTVESSNARVLNVGNPVDQDD